MKQLESFTPEVVTVEYEKWPELHRVTTSLVYHEWASLLRSHPVVEFSSYVLTGLVQGFCIEFNRAKIWCVWVKNNMQLALQHPSVVEDYLQKEVAFG